MPNAYPPASHPHNHPWRDLIALFLFFWFFSAFVPLLLLLSGSPDWLALKRTAIASLLWLIVPLLFPRLTKPFCAVVGLLLWGCSLLAVGYVALYDLPLMKSAFFVIFESSPTEAGEFFRQMFTWKIPALIALYSLVSWYLWRCLHPVWLPKKVVSLFSIITLLAIFAPPFFRYGLMPRATSEVIDRLERNAFWDVAINYTRHTLQLQQLQRLNAAGTQVADLVDATGNAPRTLVLVIGESTSKSRMSLYGYARPTTPHLRARAEAGELAVFTNAVAPAEATVHVLSLALNFADSQHPELLFERPSLIRLMQQAGYKTFWIENQAPGFQDSLQTAYAQQADTAQFLNLNNRWRGDTTTSLDENVLPAFQTALANPAPRKFIVVHLMGAHSKFDQRYPTNFAHFSGEQGTPAGLTAGALATYNAYDNAVLYDDFVLDSLIGELAQSGEDGFLLYFSDHGEEVYDTPPHDRLGRNVGEMTRNALEVPFLLWRSPGWQRAHPLDLHRALDRPFSTEDLIYTVSDLAGLSYAGFAPERSIVNPAFVPRPRWVGYPGAILDFDRHFGAAVR
ncbi:MAG: phosphoethanolamine transferase CptA [Zoogloeaceae bacterium]|jgi:heptose-I-phosphate ethanolaminephosphotransferase|nr:phosphoethanolamine transferase CptA [Zoogloeaceae bacterium]